jgi:hypothetical protein
MKWLLIVAIYAAPYDSVNWDGPWELGMTKILEQRFDSEAECRNSAIRLIAKMHEGMLAPMRFRCVSIDDKLPKGTAR